jgi:hypothetical protein
MYQMSKSSGTSSHSLTYVPSADSHSSSASSSSTHSTSASVGATIQSCSPRPFHGTASGTPLSVQLFCSATHAGSVDGPSTTPSFLHECPCADCAYHQTLKYFLSIHQWPRKIYYLIFTNIKIQWILLPRKP